MYDLAAIVVWTLAATMLTDLWFNASPLAVPRDVATRAASRANPPFWSRLLSCPYCCSFWTAAIVAGVSFLRGGAIAIAILAVCRVATLCDLLLPGRARFGRIHDAPEIDDDRTPFIA